MKLVYRTLIAACIVAGMASAAVAGENANAKLVLHISAPVSKSACTAIPSDCRTATVAGAVGNFYFAYLCVANHSDSVGVAGAQFGIDYNGTTGEGVDVFEWRKCGDLEFSGEGWPGANTGNIVTWVKTTNCQIGPAMTAAGYFYIGAYTADRMSIIPRPVDGWAKVADCSAKEDNLTGQSPSALGYVDFGTGSGYNPCATIVPVQEATWSSVKTLFR
jgi:hypothetical protein